MLSTEAAVVVLAEAAEVEGSAEAAVVVIKILVRIKVKVRERSLLNIQICHQESGKDVISTENGGGGLISVLSLPPAPGKMYSRQDNETGTSPVRVLVT